MRRLPRKKTREQESSAPYYTLIIIGDNEVGKTQLLHRLNKEDFQREYFPTFGVDFRTKTNFDEKGKLLYDIQMIDFAGEKDDMHKSLINEFVDIANIFLVVFDISKEISVIKAMDIRKEYESKITNHNINRKWYLIGNKKDLDISDNKIPPQYRDKYDNYFEISCKNSIEEEFQKILDLIIFDLNLSNKETKNLIKETEKENEPFNINFLEAHGKVFDEDCIIF